MIRIYMLIRPSKHSESGRDIPSARFVRGARDTQPLGTKSGMERRICRETSSMVVAVTARAASKKGDQNVVNMSPPNGITPCKYRLD